MVFQKSAVLLGKLGWQSLFYPWCEILPGLSTDHEPPKPLPDTHITGPHIHHHNHKFHVTPDKTIGVKQLKLFHPGRMEATSICSIKAKVKGVASAAGFSLVPWLSLSSQWLWLSLHNTKESAASSVIQDI